MRIVTAQELESWLASGKVLEKDARGAKVVALDSGLFLKILHTRRHPLLARLQPAALRFNKNTERLRQLGIAAPKVMDAFWIDRALGLTGCLYEPLLGQSFEQIYRQAPQKLGDTLPSLACFIQKLHHRGIYFRSLHLGNILHLDDGQYGLIDVLDMQFKGKPLNRWLIRRNFQHLHHYLLRHKLEDFPMNELLDNYWQKL